MSIRDPPDTFDLEQSTMAVAALPNVQGKVSKILISHLVVTFVIFVLVVIPAIVQSAATMLE